jgi:SAM-dependent methyltransferase
MTERHVPGTPGDIASYQDKLHKARYRWAVDQLKNINGTIVDVACGAGYGSRMLAEGTRCDVVGIDVSQEAVAYAASNYGASRLDFRVGDAQRLQDFASGSVNAIVSFETIEHLTRPGLFLAEAARVLAHDGVLLLSTPNRLLASTLYPIRNRPNNPAHLFEYTMEGFQADIRSALHLKEMCGQGFVPKLLAFWPVQVAAKGACHLLRGLGAYALIDSYYHNLNDTDILPVSKWRRRVPSNFVAVCTLPSRSAMRTELG